MGVLKYFMWNRNAYNFQNMGNTNYHSKGSVWENTNIPKLRVSYNSLEREIHAILKTWDEWILILVVGNGQNWPTQPAQPQKEIFYPKLYFYLPEKEKNIFMLKEKIYYTFLISFLRIFMLTRKKTYFLKENNFL